MSAFNICIIQPTGYVHSLAFLELAELLKYSLIDLDHKASISYNHIETNAINIIIGCHLLDPANSKFIPRDTIILNTEQLEKNNFAWQKTILEWGRRLPIWDYSIKNIQWFSENGINHAKHLRLGYQPQLDRLNKHHPKDIDVLFYGCINERRSIILNNLINRGLRVQTLFGIYGAARDRFIERSKIVINIHYYESQIFEIVRVFYLITNSVPVISEVNRSTSIDTTYRSSIEHSNYQNLAEATQKIIENQSKLDLLRLTANQEIQKYPQKFYTEELLLNTNAKI
jgi:hypothetical protein